MRPFRLHLPEYVRATFPWPLLPVSNRLVAALGSGGILAALLLSRLALLPHGAWEQDEALLACGVIDFDPAQHMPLPPGFALWIYIGRLVRWLGVADPLVALQLASAVLSVIGLWALVGLWDGLAGRSLALAGAIAVAFVPGVWFHAARAFSETPAAAVAIVGLAFWLRGGMDGFVPGVAAMTCAALIRPPLAPFFMLAVILAAWGVRRRPRAVVAGAVVAVLIVLAVMVPAILEAGGMRLFWKATRIHASEHLGGLGTAPLAFADLGFTRGLVSSTTAAGMLVLAALGWLAWRRLLGWRWWAGTIAGAWLVYLLLFLHTPRFPRYWVLVWLLLATPAVAGARVLVRSTALTAAITLGGACWLGWVAWPAVSLIHARPLPVVAALETVAADATQNRPVLVFDDQLFSFRNLAVKQGWLRASSMRLSELESSRLLLGGNPIWFLNENEGQDVPCTASRVLHLDVGQPEVERLSQERFLHLRLVRNPLLVWRGGSDPELDSTHRFIWCGAKSVLLVPPVSGTGRLVLGLDVHPLLGRVELVASVGEQETLRTSLDPGRHVVAVPLPQLPVLWRLNKVLPLQLEVSREIELAGDRRPMAIRVFGGSLEAPPHEIPPVSFFPDPDSAFDALALVDGTYGAEVMGPPPTPATWTSARATFELPMGPGVVGIDILSPRESLANVTVRLGSASAHIVVNDGGTVALPVPDDFADAMRGKLEVESSTFVPGGGDSRTLGVAVARIWFSPKPI